MFDLKKFVLSFKYAAKGILNCLKNEQNIKVHLVCAIMVIALSVYLKISKIEFLLILLCIALVITLEMVNTAIENLVDEVSLEKRQSLGDIKDIMAGAVLVAAIASAVIGLLIFVPYL